MKFAVFVLVVILALAGPVALPLYFIAVRNFRAFRTFLLSNIITILPMAAMTTFFLFFPGPSCREINPDAPCDSYDAIPGWLIFSFIFGVLTIYGVLASAIATAVVNRRRQPQ